MKKPHRRRGREGSAPGGRRDFTLAQVARAVGGRVLGDAALRLTGVAALADGSAGGPLLGRRRAPRFGGAARSSAGALLASSEDLARREARRPRPANPRPRPGRMARRLVSPPPGPRRGCAAGPSGSHGAQLGHGSLGRAPERRSRRAPRVGARTVLRSGAYVGKDAVLGEDCLLHPNAAVLDALPDRRALHPPRGSRRRIRRVRLRLGRRGAPQDPAGRDRARRGRRRDRRERGDRPRDARRDGDRPRDQDRQPRAGRPQRRRRRALGPLRPGRHRRVLPDRRAASRSPARSGSRTT